MEGFAWRAGAAFALVSAALFADGASRPAGAEQSMPAASAPPAPAATPGGGGKGAPANPAGPESETANDPCGGRGRLLATLNRPTVGYSACAVPAGSIVLEEGYQNQSQGGVPGNVATSYPQGFERIGVANRLELDAIGPNFNRSKTGGALSTGYNDLGLGFKYELPQRGRFTYGVDGLFTAATGQPGFSAGEPTQTLDFDIAYGASPAVGFATTIAGASSAGFTSVGNAARYGYLLPSIVVTAQIPNYYQFYAELVAQTKLGPDQGGRIFTDFGVQKLLGPYLELDVEYADSFTPVGGSRFHYVGIGTGIRVK